MGWTGTYIGRCPKGAERIAEAVRQEGVEWSDEKRGIIAKVIDSALVGSTVYCAVHYINEEKNIDEVYGCVILTHYKRGNGEFTTKAISETMGPGDIDCPKRILEKLSPTDREFAIKWRERCKARLAEKTSDRLAKVDFGKAVKLTGKGYEGITLYAYKRKKTKVFVDYFSNCYYTQKQVRTIGYEVA